MFRTHNRTATHTPGIKGCRPGLMLKISHCSPVDCELREPYGVGWPLAHSTHT